MVPLAATPVRKLDEFRPESRRGADGFFQVAQNGAGQWWLLDPRGEPCWLRAVHGVEVAGAGGDAALPRDSAVRLRSWGFTAVGVGGDGAGRDDGLPYFRTVDFCAAAPAVTGPGLHLPDVFDPHWVAQAERHAIEVCSAHATQRQLIGWVTDDHPGWAQPTGEGRPSLLQLCLSLEPSHAAYHAAWEFTLALHGGRLEAMARAWGLPLANKAVVRELSRTEIGLSTRGYLRDEARWTREYARRYFTTTATAIRAADPNHLVVGCRFGAPVGSSVLREAIYPSVDLGMPDWRELPAGTDPVSVNPVIAGEVCWAAREFGKVPTAARLLRLTSLEWMLRRGRQALERAARHPLVVGYIWRQWQDEPGEQPPFARGLVHVNGAEAREHTELLAELNFHAESLRRSAALPSTP